MNYVPESAEVVRAVLEAEDIARRSSQPPNSAHLLLSFFTFTNRAQVLLGERGISEDDLMAHMGNLDDEPRRTLQRVRERARGIAQSSGSKEIDCLHMLIAMSRLRDAFAYTLLDRTTSLTALRNVAVSYVTGSLPRRYRSLPKVERSPLHLSRARTKKSSVRELILEQDPEAAELEAPQPIPKPKRRTTPKPAPEPAQSEEAFPSSDAHDGDEPDDDHDLTEHTIPQRPLPDFPSPAADIDIEEIAPTLAACGIDLTALARSGRLDLAIGRDAEIEKLIDILGKRRANNPILVGHPGVGKTAIVEGFAVKIARQEDDVCHFHDRMIFSLDTGALVAGTSLRGAFSERIAAIKQEVADADGKIIVFIDEIHTLMGAGASGDGPQDAANELKTALARGEFPCIGATTHGEFKKYIEKDPALERRFDPINVEEPSVDAAILILEGAVGPYADHHSVAYAMEAVHAAVQLSHRFITERKLPDKAFAVLDLAGSRARRRGSEIVTRLDIARVINEWSGVPLERLAEAENERFNRAEEILSERLIGHPDVLKAVSVAIRRGFAGFNSHRPMGSFLFLGPTGVGKTELVKILAEFLFGRRDAIVRIDMSELSERHSVSRLIGAQPGYVGHEEGGQLTEALRKKPFQIVLFDEIEKAHQDVLNILLQVLDEGHLTDSKGRRVSFANTLIILTSNLGAEAFSGGTGRAIGFGGGAGKEGAHDGPKEKALSLAQESLPPELWGRLDERLVFSPLEREDVRKIAELQLAESSKNLFSEREISLEWQPEVVDFLLDHGGFAKATGARGMRQAIQQHVEAPIAEGIMAGDLAQGDLATLWVNTQNPQSIAIERAER